MPKPSLKFTGGREIEKALAELPRGTAKGVATRTIKKELAPVAAMANALSPYSQDDVVKVSSRLAPGQRKPRLGRDAVYQNVGADYKVAGLPAPHWVEFGTGPRTRWKTTGAPTGAMPATPFLRPAWDMHRAGLLDGLGRRMWDEITKTLARRAKKAGN